jgi:hypothetical protein
MTNEQQLQKAFSDYFQLAKITLRKGDKEPSSISQLRPLQPSSWEIKQAVSNLEMAVEFQTLVRSTSSVFPLQGFEILDFRHYEVENFFRRSRSYTSLYAGNYIDKDIAFRSFLDAFSRETIQVRYLVPLRSVDFAKELMQFKSFRIQHFSAEELNEILQNELNDIFYPSHAIDVSKIEGYWFIDVVDSEPTIPVDEVALPDLSPSARREFTQFPKAVANALQPLILHNWDLDSNEQVTHKHGWEPGTGWTDFDIPFLLELTDDLLHSPRWVPPIPHFSTEPRIEENGDETEVPYYHILMTDDEATSLQVFVSEFEAILARLASTNTHWGFMEIAFGFLSKAFFAEGLQQLLWHMIVLESLLGEDTEGLTSLLRNRLSLILADGENERAVKRTFNDLYDFRSRLVHGDEKLLEQKIYVGHLRDARNLARRTLVWFLRYLDNVQRRYQEVSQPDGSLPTRKELLAAIDLREDSRARISQLLNILPDKFPRNEAW